MVQKTSSYQPHERSLVLRAVVQNGQQNPCMTRVLRRAGKSIAPNSPQIGSHRFRFGGMFNAVQMSYRCGSEHKLEAAASLKEDPMTRMTLSKIAALMVCVPGFAVAQPIEKRGTTPYVTHFIFRPLMSIDIPGLGTATNLEAVGTTQNMKGEKMLDKMSARCAALSVASGDKKYIDGACVLTDNDGDQIFSTFDTRDLDKSQPQMNCGTHIITGGTGKYKGITGSEPFACISLPALAGPGGYTAMDIPHNTTWEIK
jgi:hypothetical protein